QSYVGIATPFHVYANERALCCGALNDKAKIRDAHVPVNIESERRELERDVGIQSLLVNPVQQVEVGIDGTACLALVLHALTQDIDRACDPGRVKQPDSRDGLLHCLTGHESPREGIGEAITSYKAKDSRLIGQVEEWLAKHE